MTAKPSTTEPDGFHGDVTGLSLSDVIQLNANNAFSGCITVHQGDRLGRIFFRDGKIVHAEQGGKLGEEAFYEIMEWRTGHFSLEPNISTTSHSIQRSTQFVLMEAHRLMDERRAGRAAAPPAAAPEVSAKRPAPATGMAARLKPVAGVRHAVLVGKNGACADGTSAEGEALAGKAAYLAVMGNQIGARLGAGEVRSAAARSAADQLLVLVAKNHYLGVELDPGRELGAAEAEIVKLLGPAA